MAEGAKVSKAQQKAVNKYVKNNYDRINVTFPKGEKEEIKLHAQSRKESVNAFIVRAVRETMEREMKGISLQETQQKKEEILLEPTLDSIQEPILVQIEKESEQEPILVQIEKESEQEPILGQIEELTHESILGQIEEPEQESILEPVYESELEPEFNSMPELRLEAEFSSELEPEFISEPELEPEVEAELDSIWETVRLADEPASVFVPMRDEYRELLKAEYGYSNEEMAEMLRESGRKPEFEEINHPSQSGPVVPENAIPEVDIPESILPEFLIPPKDILEPAIPENTKKETINLPEDMESLENIITRLCQEHMMTVQKLKK